MKYLLVIGLVIMVSIVVYSCKTAAKNGSDGKAEAPMEDEIVTSNIVMGLSKSSCKGTCEVYDITIDKNRKASYKGIKNTSLIGDLTAKLNQAQFDKLKELFDKTTFAEHQPDYTTRIRDLQRFRMEFKGHSVVFQKKAGPKDLFPIIEAFDNLIKELDWIEPLEDANMDNSNLKKKNN